VRVGGVVLVGPAQVCAFAGVELGGVLAGILYEEAMQVGGRVGAVVVSGWVGGRVGGRAGGWVLPAVTDWPALAGGCCEG
jgi:hypothetical protein